MTHPYRSPIAPSDDDEGINEVDAAVRQRRVGTAIGAASLAILGAMLPLALALVAVLPFESAVIAWLTVGVLQVVLAFASADQLLVARERDRRVAQGRCAWLAGASLVVAALGLLTIIAMTVLVSFAASLGPFCGACGT